MTCTAVSYPEANPDTDYIIQHPIGETLIHEHITSEMDGVIYAIESAVDSDSGTFQCHLTVYCMEDTPMMNETVKILTVTNETSKTLHRMYSCYHSTFKYTSQAIQ